MENKDTENEQNEKEVELIERARSSAEVKEAKRITKNVKLQLINKLKQHSTNIATNRSQLMKIVHDLEQEEREIKKQIKAIKIEINLN